MKKAVIIVVIIVVVLGAGLLVRNRMQHSAPQPSSQAVKPAPNQAYLTLRNQALTGSRAKFKLPAGPKPTGPWGVLMDMGLPDGWATIAAFSDANASVYFSNGGGYIGGGGRETIRKAGQNMLAVATEFQPSAHTATEYPLPPTGQTTFYFLTDAGVFTLSASQDDLGNRRVPVSKLFFAGQDVINEYRRLQQQGAGAPVSLPSAQQAPASRK